MPKKYWLKSRTGKNYISDNPRFVVNEKNPNKGEWTRQELDALYASRDWDFFPKHYKEELVPQTNMKQKMYYLEIIKTKERYGRWRDNMIWKSGYTHDSRYWIKYSKAMATSLVRDIGSSIRLVEDIQIEVYTPSTRRLQPGWPSQNKQTK